LEALAVGLPVALDQLLEQAPALTTLGAVSAEVAEAAARLERALAAHHFIGSTRTEAMTRAAAELATVGPAGAPVGEAPRVRAAAG